MAAITAKEYWDGYFAEAEAEGFPVEEDASWLKPFVELLKPNGGKAVLELGCGLGAQSISLVNEGFLVTALDLSEQAIAIARRRVPHIDLRQADITQPLPFPDSSFDGVLSCLTLHYFPYHETMAVFSEIHRVLRPGGFLFFTVNSTKDRAHGFGTGDPPLHEIPRHLGMEAEGDLAGPGPKA